MEASALDELAEGRLTLGIGAGLAAPIKRLGIDNAKTLAALEDTFAIVRGLMAGETVTYKGKAFAVEDVKLSYKPRRPDLPILLAARGPKALALAAEFADGLMVSNMCPPGFARWAASIARPARTRAIRAVRRRGRPADGDGGDQTRAGRPAEDVLGARAESAGGEGEPGRP